MFYIFAAVAVFAGLYVGKLTAYGIFSTIFLLLLVACAAADLNAGIVPDLIVLLIAALGIIRFFVTEPLSFSAALPYLIGAVCVSVPMLVTALLIKGGFGGGDFGGGAGGFGGGGFGGGMGGGMPMGGGFGGF